MIKNCEDGEFLCAEILVRELKNRELFITTAESCTGGMLSSALINVPGASWVLNESHITYSNEAKMKYLGVKAETLDKYGAVSQETAAEMAEGAAILANADCSIAVTGIAGPDGGTKDKPVGTVYVGYYFHGHTKVVRYNFEGDRLCVRKQTVETAIESMIRLLKEWK